MMAPHENPAEADVVASPRQSAEAGGTDRASAPLPLTRPARVMRNRLWAMLLLALSVGILGTARALEPSSAGTGTHMQLGLPPCGLKVSAGIPCLTCGMTTAFSHAVRGQFVASFLTQPGGFLLSVLLAMVAVASAVALFTGGAIHQLLLMLFSPRTVVVGVVLLLLAWIYKVVVELT